MDNFFFRLGLIALSCIVPGVVFAGCVDCGPTSGTYEYEGQARSACQLYFDQWNAQNPGRQADMYCGTSQAGQPTGQYWVRGHGGIAGKGPWSWTKLSPNPCADMDSSKIYQHGKVLAGSKSCVRGKVQPDGSQAMCGVSINPISPPTFNPYTGGGWETYVSVTPTGTICGEGSGDQPGAITGPAGDTGPHGPPLPDPVPQPDNDPPDLCGGVSCYDPTTGEACAMVDGAQVCTSSGLPGGSGSGGSGGGCAKSGDTTICSGSPTAPAPPPGDVPDPPGQTQGTDTRTHANPSTGATTTTQTTVYGMPGQAPNSGQKAGDSGPAMSGGGSTGGGTGGDPAPSGSTSGPAGSLSGGGDCNNPPACSGDVVLCGIVKQQWLTMCSAKKSADQARKDLVGDGTAPATEPAKTSADVWQAGDGYAGDAVGAAANGGVYDQSGFGAPTACPLVDLEVPLWDGRSFAVQFSKGCDLLGWIRALVIAFALFAAVRITMGGLG